MMLEQMNIYSYKKTKNTTKPPNSLVIQKMNLRYMTDLNVKHLTFRGEKTRNKTKHKNKKEPLGSSTKQLRLPEIKKVQSKINWTSSKSKTLVMQKTI